MEIEKIENSRRILAVALAQSSDHLSRVIKDLTGSHPTPAAEESTLAGTTHALTLKTLYYTATVPVWLDLITTPSEWATTFLSPEAKEVLNVLGGIIVVFPISGIGFHHDSVRDLIREMGRVIRDGLGGWSWDGVTLGVGVGNRASEDELEKWDDCCADAGLEFVHVDPTASPTITRNEFGEAIGISRVLDALEANDWAQGLGGGLGADGQDDFLQDIGEPPVPALDDPESLDLGLTGDDDDMLRVAILESSRSSNPGDATDDRDAKDEDDNDDNDDDDHVTEGDVEKIELVMQKLLAVREAGLGMDEEQRRRMAARAVAEVMREL